MVSEPTEQVSHFDICGCSLIVVSDASEAAGGGCLCRARGGGSCLPRWLGPRQAKGPTRSGSRCGAASSSCSSPGRNRERRWWCWEGWRNPRSGPPRPARLRGGRRARERDVPRAPSGPLRRLDRRRRSAIRSGVRRTKNSTPEQSFYDSQELVEGFQYIETRDGTTLSAYVVLPGPIEEGPYSHSGRVQRLQPVGSDQRPRVRWVAGSTRRHSVRSSRSCARHRAPAGRR